MIGRQMVVSQSSTIGPKSPAGAEWIEKSDPNEIRFGGVGREGVEPPKLSRRFYRPLGSPRALCRPSTPTSGGKREA